MAHSSLSMSILAPSVLVKLPLTGMQRRERTISLVCLLLSPLVSALLALFPSFFWQQRGNEKRTRANYDCFMCVRPYVRTKLYYVEVVEMGRILAS